MKITYLLGRLDEMGGTQAAVLAQTRALADRHDIALLSVLRTADAPFFATDERVRVSHMVDARGPVHRPIRSGSGQTAGQPGDAELAALTALPSELVPPGGEPGFHRLCDLEVMRALPRLDTDVLVATTPALTSLAARFAPPDAVLVGQEHRASEMRGPSGDPLLPYAPRMDAVAVLTEASRDWLAASLGAAAPRLDVLPNPAPDGFAPRSSLDAPVVLLAGRLVAEKQVDHAIRAFADAAAEHPEWRLRICGSGPEEPGLRSLADGLELAGRVEFAGARTDMAQEWARASVCLLSSRTEAFPTVLTEAFAAGVPAVSYDCPTGPAEIIRHGTDGFLSAADDAGALSAALSKLMGDRELRQRMGAAALAGVGRFAPDAVAQRWEELFGALAAVPPAERAAARADRAAHFAAAAAAGGGTVLPAPAWEHTRPRVPGLKEHERALLELPGTERSGGQVTEVRDGLQPQDALGANLDLAAGALDAAGIAHHLVRHSGRNPRLAIGAERAAEAASALAAAHGSAPVYVQAIDPRGAPPQPVPAGLLGAVDLVTGSAGLRVFRPSITGTRTLRYGAGYGADIEFWADDGSGGRTAPRRNAIGAGLAAGSLAPARITRYGRERPTWEPFTRTLMDDIDFPIDAVVPWVDGSDPRWRERRDAALAEEGGRASPDGAAENRFTDAGELRYALRSMAMFAPWIRTVHVVTDGQVPDWLDAGHPQISLVDHRDLFRGTGRLPTFNSRAIGSRLYRITGSAEHLLVFNDDVFLGRPLRPQAFFLPSGLPKFFRSSTAVPFTPVDPADPAYDAARKNGRALIEERFGRSPAHGYRHAPHATRRSLLAEVAEAFPEEVARTAEHRFRSPDDVSMPGALDHDYAALAGLAVPGEVHCEYVDAGDPEHHRRLSVLLAKRSYDVFCVTDSPPDRVPRTEQAAVIRAFLASYFPVAAPWERPGRGADPG
ncbi:stealth conserved region 3 domain-containing protein [Nocardiopsis coralliicola]